MPWILFLIIFFPKMWYYEFMIFNFPAEETNVRIPFKYKSKFASLFITIE